jgi:bifunctional non-homologous end joining protein LigD
MLPSTPIIPFEPIRKFEVPTASLWIYQIKWDGVRVLTYYDGKECKLFNRKLNERTQHYPELLKVKDYCNAQSVILDGEIIALASDGKPSFHEVMKRDGIRRMERIESVKKIVPITFVVFDILFYNGEWVTHLPLAKRNQLLSEAVLPNQSVQLATSFDDGEALFQLMRQQGMEGIVCKKTDSSYAVNGKDERWIKVKNYGDLNVVIGGFTLNGGVVNAVLVGVYDAKGLLCYIGHVGTGKLKKTEWVQLTALLKPMIISHRPFENAHPNMKGAIWVEPRLTVKVSFSEWRWKEGRSLRQPSIQAFVDVPPKDCIFAQMNTES